MTHDPICPRCQQLNSKVIDTRRSMAGSVWRRRECNALILVDGIEQVCGQRFTTYEQVNTAPRMRALMVSLSIGRDVSS